MSKHAGANDDTYKIEIINCDLYARIVDVDASINKEIENISYQGNSMLYPMRRVKWNNIEYRRTCGTCP